ncbi:CLUMA_CG006368, isoform A [Clunio marinus]|uniref:CLUMA_CG006368, isoform A n=1 Tax=Clunio marinus TaxID=568069 RepID=A0A1J1HYN6_9DIPT|nr:CLUMA_CG006368, isoform A [Clunio marinus]
MEKQFNDIYIYNNLCTITTYLATMPSLYTQGSLSPCLPLTISFIRIMPLKHNEQIHQDGSTSVIIIVERGNFSGKVLRSLQQLRQLSHVVKNDANSKQQQ